MLLCARLRSDDTNASFEQQRVQSATRAYMVTMYDRIASVEKSYTKNYNHEDDLKYTLEMCQWLLKPLGVWTLIYHRVSKLGRAASVVMLFLCLSCFLFVIIPSFNNIFFAEKNVANKVQLFGPAIFCVFSTVKYCYLGVKGKTLGRCIQHVERDWRMVQHQHYRAIMLKQAGISRRLITFLSNEMDTLNVTARSLAYPCFEFLDVQSSPTYEIVFFLHCLAGIIMCTATMAAYSLAATFVTHICGQIQIQIIRLENLIDESREKNNFHERMAIIVRDHVKVLRFSRDVDEGLREICLTEIADSTLSMCMLEYYCMLGWKNNDKIAMVTYLMLLTSFTFTALIYCYVGELLSEQFSQIGRVSYNIHWYNLSAREAYNFVLLEAISLYPPKLTAGKMIELSINTFGIVVKTSVVYLNLLRTVAT
ncbi:odorant receptor 13a-like isoform X2 [Nomia melanderi]|uniref:odorant receptor 13a-like isoform X2 n=1 Tax=Nomia melanderi TaxID=2448451 RepID=UPI003FCD3D95